MEVTAMNLANVNTPGFQASRVQFSEWFNPQQNGAALPGEQQIAYTQDRATWRDSQAGTLTQTGNPFDLALRNGGYFTVATDRGPRLTRDGTVWTVTERNDRRRCRKCVAGCDRQAAPTRARAIRRSPSRRRRDHERERPTRQNRRGDAHRSDEAAGRGRHIVPGRHANDAGRAAGVVQGVLEGSNVPPVLEVTRMMNDLRDYQFTTQLIQAEDDRIQSTIDKTLPPAPEDPRYLDTATPRNGNLTDAGA